jgi:chorismate-pyruvate lyase
MKSEPDPRDPVARAVALVQLFCSLDDFGGLRSIASSEVPEPARTLLDHRSHMTVAMERFHGGDVRLRVVARAGDGSGQRPDDGWYAREILLETQAGTIVQHGIVRIDLSHLDPEAAAAIREARRPLGRILIEAGMLREVHGVKLLEIMPGLHLQQVLQLTGSQATGIAAATPVYGRVADIQLDGRPAVELLEIVAPAVSSVG